MYSPARSSREMSRVALQDSTRQLCPWCQCRVCSNSGFIRFMGEVKRLGVCTRKEAGNASGVRLDLMSMRGAGQAFMVDVFPGRERWALSGLCKSCGCCLQLLLWIRKRIDWEGKSIGEALFLPTGFCYLSLGSPYTSSPMMHLLLIILMVCYA